MNKEFERIKKEYEDFRLEVLLLSKEEIYDEAFKIKFYTSMIEYLEEMQIDIKCYITLYDLFSFYTLREHLHCDNFLDIELLLKEYISLIDSINLKKLRNKDRKISLYL